MLKDYNFIVTQSLNHSCLSQVDANKSRTFMLPGGRAATSLYDYWCVQGIWDANLYSYYFGDERCVS